MYQGGIATDNAGRLQLLEPSQAGGRGKGNTFGQLNVAQSSVVLQGLKDFQVDFVKRNSGCHDSVSNHTTGLEIVLHAGELAAKTVFQGGLWSTINYTVYLRAVLYVKHLEIIRHIFHQ